MRDRKKICIIGVGLIGGSIGLGLRRRRLAHEVIGVGRHLVKLKKAKRIGAVDRYTNDWKRGVEDADICIIATPVTTIPKIFKRIYPFLKKGCVVTDAGSVKTPVVKEIESFLSRQKSANKVFFVGSHPLAGSENAGVNFAKANLLENAIVVVTPGKRTSKKAMSEIKGFWTKLGSRIIVMDTELHDRVLSVISHLPHVVAFSLVRMIANLKHVDKVITSGFRDTTRIAGSDKRIWTDVLVSNRRNVSERIDEFIKILKDFKNKINNSDTKILERHLTKISNRRKSL